MYKNWKAICEIPDHHVMWALALLDIATDFGRQLTERLPEYFTHEPQAGPIPLSVLRDAARRNAVEDCGVEGEAYADELVTQWACHKFNIPTHKYTLPGAQEGLDGDMLPPELAYLADIKEIGHVGEWAGKQVAVVEIWEGQQIHLAPAELIAVDR